MSLKPGMRVFIRTMVFAFTGTITEVDKNFVYLREAAWIADTGQFGHFLTKGAQNKEYELYPDFCALSLGHIVDWCPFGHQMP